MQDGKISQSSSALTNSGRVHYWHRGTNDKAPQSSGLACASWPLPEVTSKRLSVRVTHCNTQDTSTTRPRSSEFHQLHAGR
eukprot:4702730-Amphidinium_carterae.2